jgi:hypothetical protein
MRKYFSYLLVVIILVIIFGSVAATPTYADTGAPFRGWLALNGGAAKLAYQSEIALSPVNGSFTIEGWINNPYLDNVIYKKSSFALSFSKIFNPSPIPGKNTYFITFLNCGYLCSGGSNEISSCAGYSSCQPQGWFHFAYVYNQETDEGTLFWNGKNLGSASLSASTEPIALQYATGMDEFRISNNVRYTASFTPSLTPFACDANTKGLWHFDEIAGSTSFHNACGTVDNMFVGSNGAHTEGVIGSKVYLPTIY